MNKEKLYDVINNPKGKLFAIDMDWTLCKWETWFDTDPESEPNQEMIDFVNWLYIKWAHIVIYTARDELLYTLTQNWLEKHRVRFHWINMKRKPWADCYIDDKALNVDDVLYNNLIQWLKKM